MKQEQAYLTCFKIIRIERAGVKFLEKILEEYTNGQRAFSPSSRHLTIKVSGV